MNPTSPVRLKNSPAADLTDAFFAWADREPASPAVISHQKVISYQQLAAMVHGAGKSLLELGVQSGQLIGVSAINDARHVALIMALAEAGAVSVPIHPNWGAVLKAEIAKDLGLSRLIGQKADWALEGLPFTHLRDLLQASTSAFIGNPRFGPSAKCGRVFFSSGSSGKPKAVLFKDDYLKHRVRQTIRVSLMGRGCRVLCGDLNYAAWGVQALATLHVGGTLIFSRSSPWDQCRALAANAVTHARFAPRTLFAILQKLGADGLFLPALKRLEVVGSGMPGDLLDAVQLNLTNRVFVTYGMTAFGFVSIAGPELLASQPGSVGQVIGEVRLEVVDENDHSVPAGETGTLRLRTTSMTDGYLADPESTKMHFRDGWFYPGDAGRMGEDGSLYLAGRVEELSSIESAAINFSELELIAREFPGVQDAVAMQIHPELERQCMMVAVTSSGSVKGLLDYLSERLGEAAPEGVARLEAFPRTFNGKISRKKLREMLEAASSNNTEKPAPVEGERA